MVIRVSDKKQNYNNVTKLLVKPIILSQSIQKKVFQILKDF